MRNKAFGISLFLVLFLVLPSSALAYNTAVLGDATSSAVPSIAPTAEGPGLILPDSKLFFLDELKQKVRLFLAFRPEAKAKVHADVAGERLAELRIMLARNDPKGVRIALAGLSENLAGASDQIYQAQLSGRDIKALAKAINLSIRRQQDALDSLAEQATGDLKAQVNLAQTVAFRAKLRVADSLPADEQQNELLDDLTRRARQQVQQSSDNSASIQITLDELNKQTQKVATGSSQSKAERIIQLQKVAIQQAKDAASSSQKAAAGFKQSSDAIGELRASGSTVSAE
ncbi:MAG: hypothetical protein HYU48_02385 [Candidatus Levybacteria bacterium]|nr:hypothetical protein [Candidatus Levybacteria bacterium]